MCAFRSKKRARIIEDTPVAHPDAADAAPLPPPPPPLPDAVPQIPKLARTSTGVDEPWWKVTARKILDVVRASLRGTLLLVGCGV